MKRAPSDSFASIGGIVMVVIVTHPIHDRPNPKHWAGRISPGVTWTNVQEREQRTRRPLVRAFKVHPKCSKNEPCVLNLAIDTHAAIPITSSTLLTSASRSACSG